MLLYHLPALVTHFPRTFIIKGNANNGINLFSYLFPALMTPFPVIAYINGKATGCINKEAIDNINEGVIGAILAPRNLPYCFLISCFTV